MKLTSCINQETNQPVHESHQPVHRDYQPVGRPFQPVHQNARKLTSQDQETTNRFMDPPTGWLARKTEILNHILARV